MRLDGKIAAVTGAGSGLGRAIAMTFAAAGAGIVALDRDAGAAQRLLAELPDSVEGHRAVGVDVADAGAVARTFELIEELDVLVNGAGIREINDPLALPADEWDRVIAVNLSGTFYCCQAAARRMVARGSGAIVNIASVTGQTGFARRPAYSASKAAVIGLTRSLGQDLAPLGVRVNAICPGLIETPLTADYLTDKHLVERLGMAIPMARAGQPDEVAQAALYLASGMSTYVTGTTLTVDGGFVAAGTFDMTGESNAFGEAQRVGHRDEPRTSR